MDTPVELSVADRQVLSAAAVAVIAALIGASPSNPLGVMQEVGAAVARFHAAASAHASNPLIAAALVDLKGSYERYTGGATTGSVDIFALARDPDAAVASVANANHLIAGYEPTHAAAYRSWLIDLAQAVAQAASEGGLMGIGGERVSSAEQALIERITAALGA